MLAESAVGGCVAMTGLQYVGADGALHPLNDVAALRAVHKQQYIATHGPDALVRRQRALMTSSPSRRRSVSQAAVLMQCTAVDPALAQTVQAAVCAAAVANGTTPTPTVSRSSSCPVLGDDEQQPAADPDTHADSLETSHQQIALRAAAETASPDAGSPAACSSDVHPMPTNALQQQPSNAFQLFHSRRESAAPRATSTASDDGTIVEVNSGALTPEASRVMLQSAVRGTLGRRLPLVVSYVTGQRHEAFTFAATLAKEREEFSAKHPSLTDLIELDDPPPQPTNPRAAEQISQYNNAARKVFSARQRAIPRNVKF